MKCSGVLFPLALVAALVAGCSGGSGGSGNKPSSLPTLTGPPPSASPAAVPEAAKAKTALGADAFVRFYFEQLNVAFSTSDSSIIRRYSDPACQTCNNYAKALEGNAKHLIRGASFLVSDVAVPPIEANGSIASVGGSIPARQVVDGAGSVIENLKSDGRFHFQVNVIRRESGWIVRGIRSVP
jgi:hypothetical protein